MAQNKTGYIEKYKNIAIVTWAIVGLVAVFYIVLFILDKISVIIPLFVYMVALVYLLRPAVEYLHKQKIPRGLAVLITYLVVAIIITLFLIYIVPIIIAQAVGLVNAYPEIKKSVLAYFNDFVNLYQKRLGGTPFDIKEGLANVLNQAKNINFAKIPASILGVTFNVVSGLLNFILAPILAFFILKDLPRIKETIVHLVPEKHRLELLEIISKVNKVLSGFLKGQFIVASVVGFLATVLFTVLRLKFAFLLGMIAGITNIVPYFGPIIGGGLAVIVALFNSPVTALLTALGMLLIQQLDSMLISPLVLKRQVNLHPVLIVFSLLIGGSLLGVLGLLLAVPVAAVSKVMVYHFIERANGFD